MMELKVIGGGCDECDRLYENVSEALKRLEMSAQIERVSELIDIVKLGVMTAPSLMKDGKLIVQRTGAVGGKADGAFKKIVNLF